jgi:hypothetical protein
MRHDDVVDIEGSRPDSAGWFNRPGLIALATVLVIVLSLAAVAFVMAPALYPPTVDPTATPASATRDAARTTAITTTRASNAHRRAGRPELFGDARLFRTRQMTLRHQLAGIDGGEVNPRQPDALRCPGFCRVGFLDARPR